MQGDSLYIFISSVPLEFFLKQVFNHWDVCFQKEEFSLFCWGWGRVHKRETAPT